MLCTSKYVFALGSAISRTALVVTTSQATPTLSSVPIKNESSLVGMYVQDLLVL